MSPSNSSPGIYQHSILTAIGSDRPGLVNEVSQFIFHRGGNIEDSRMVNLYGQFAMMVLIGGSQEVMKRISAELAELSKTSGLHAEVHPAGPAQEPGGGKARPYRLTATAMDQSGLVHRISHLLHAEHVNIESLDTRLSAAPYTGAPVFEMELILLIPQATPIAGLREKLAKLCDEMNIDWELKEEK